MKTGTFSLSAAAMIFTMVALPACGGDVKAPNSKETVRSGTVAPGTVSATAEGREIRAVARESVSINTSGADATVNLGKHVLKIEKARLQLNEQMPSNIPAATKLVEIRLADETLTVTADGKEVLIAKLAE